MLSNSLAYSFLFWNFSYYLSLLYVVVMMIVTMMCRMIVSIEVEQMCGDLNFVEAGNLLIMVILVVYVKVSRDQT